VKNQEFDFSVDVLQALLWQYNDASALQSLLESKQAWYDANQTGFWNDWFTNVFDLTTANDFGCSVWALILGVPLSVILPPDTTTKRIWGFGPYRKNFSNSNFANQKQAVIPLTLPQKRLVLQLRYIQLISRGIVPETNARVQRVFTQAGLGKVYVLDGLNMTMDYVFAFVLPSAVSFVLTSYDLLPRPAGVGIRFIESVRPTFGFGAFHKNFNNGNFRV
jgi:hypothetical protein